MVKRYDLSFYEGISLEDNGSFVHYDDYAALKSELDALRDQVRWRDAAFEHAKDGEWYVVRAYRESKGSMMTTIAFCDKDSETGETVWLPHDSCVVFDYDTDVLDVTHWMPLPTPPTSQSNKD